MTRTELRETQVKLMAHLRSIVTAAQKLHDKVAEAERSDDPLAGLPESDWEEILTDAYDADANLENTLENCFNG